MYVGQINQTRAKRPLKRSKTKRNKETVRQNAYTPDLRLNCYYYFTTLFDAESNPLKLFVYKALVKLY